MRARSAPQPSSDHLGRLRWLRVPVKQSGAMTTCIRRPEPGTRAAYGNVVTAAGLASVFVVSARRPASGPGGAGVRPQRPGQTWIGLATRPSTSDSGPRPGAAGRSGSLSSGSGRSSPGKAIRCSGELPARQRTKVGSVPTTRDVRPARRRGLDDRFRSRPTLVGGFGNFSWRHSGARSPSDPGSRGGPSAASTPKQPCRRGGAPRIIRASRFELLARLRPPIGRCGSETRTHRASRRGRGRQVLRPVLVGQKERLAGAARDLTVAALAEGQPAPVLALEVTESVAAVPGR